MYNKTRNPNEKAPVSNRRRFLETSIFSAGAVALAATPLVTKAETTNGSVSLNNANGQISTLKTFNVSDFGAVSNGRNDDSAAVLAALNAAKAVGGGTIVFPVGVTHFGLQNGANPMFNTGEYQRGIYIFQGAESGKSSAIKFNSSYIGLALGNAASVVVRNLVIEGQYSGEESNNVPDADFACFYFSFCDEVLFENVLFAGLGVSANSSAAGVISTQNCSVRLSNCYFGGCAVPGNAVVYHRGTGGLEIDKCFFPDYVYWKGIQFRKMAKIGATQNWVKISELPNPTNAYHKPVALSIKNSRFDENAASALCVEGDGYDYAVELENLSFNSGIGGSGLSGDFRNLRRVSMKNIWDGYYANTAPYETFKFTNVKQIEIDNLIHGAGAKTIGLEGACGSLLLKNSKNAQVRNPANAFVEVLPTQTLDKTSAYNITLAENGYTFTNDGASGGIIFKLPMAKDGVKLKFLVQAAQYLTVLAQDGEFLQNGAEISASGGGLTSSVVGSFLELEVIKGRWIVTKITGAWATAMRS